MVDAGRTERKRRDATRKRQSVEVVPWCASMLRNLSMYMSYLAYSTKHIYRITDIMINSGMHGMHMLSMNMLYIAQDMNTCDTRPMSRYKVDLGGIPRCLCGDRCA